MGVGRSAKERRIGFRRWYERRLYESYAWLASCLLCGVAIAAVAEFVGFRGSGATPYLALLAVYVVGLLAVNSFTRFWKVLSHAQRRADAARCPSCDTYGDFELPVECDQVPARCGRCGHCWTIAD